MGKKYFLPPGSRDILGEEGEKLWEAESKLASLFYRSGLKRVYPPLLEYWQVFTRGIGEEKEKKTYKFVDPASGELFVLRSDVTPQIVRLWWSRGFPEKFGVYYFERVVRIEGAFSGIEREIFQGGVELLHCTEPERKIVGLLKGVVDELGLEDATIVAGSTELISELVGIAPDLEDCFRRRDVSCLERGGVPSQIVELAITRRKNVGDLPPVMTSKMNEIEKLFSDEGLKVIVDPFLFPPSSYYNGIVFSVIYKGEEIVVGGRYDGLLERFGKKAPAAGFAINLLSLVSLI